MSPADLRDLPYRANAGVVLINDAGLVFAGRRVGMADAWQMPQGGIDKGESPREAALRELEEEIGTRKGEVLAETAAWLTYDLPEHLVGKALKGRYRGQKQKWFAMRFTGSDGEIDIAGVEHPEFDAWTWMTSGALLARIVDFKRDIYRRVFEEFRAHLTA
jgi:putative (di)nucleoside polyphosphate hydrolase